LVHLTLTERPPNATHWSVRTMGVRAAIAPSSVQKIWKAHGLKPHLTPCTIFKFKSGVFLSPNDALYARRGIDRDRRGVRQGRPGAAAAGADKAPPRAFLATYDIWQGVKNAELLS
jgi:hypothetical protein